MSRQKHRKKTTILYMGGFVLPDKNAAAQRVIANAKAMRDIGCDVLFLNTPEKMDRKRKKKVMYSGFTCYEMGRKSKADYMLSGTQAIAAIKSIRPDAIIAYNYPAIALSMIMLYCKTHAIKCYADLTEWYLPKGNLYHGSVLALDVALRMKLISPKSDGIIAISSYLFRYYKDKTKTVLVPPLVDPAEEKWSPVKKEVSPETAFIYAGSPDSVKERLDLIIEAFHAVINKKPAKLYIVGITEQEFREIYQWDGSIDKHVIFYGRVPHQKAVELVKHSDWAIVIRERNLSVMAGFPTKVAEAISCGVPVLANDFSDLFEYLDQSNSIQTRLDKIKESMLQACEKRLTPDKTIFDYRKYIHKFEELLS